MEADDIKRTTGSLIIHEIFTWQMLTVDGGRKLKVGSFKVHEEAGKNKCMHKEKR